MEKSRGFIIAITNPKGGAGKSTTGQNIACAFVDLGYRVAILDADSKQVSIYSWAERRKLYASETGANPTNPSVRIVAGDFSDTIKEAAAANDIVIIDVAGRRSKELTGALMQCDLVLYPNAPTIKDIEIAPKFIEELDMTEMVGLEHRKAYGFLTRVGSKTQKGKKRAQQGREFFKRDDIKDKIIGLSERIDSNEVFNDADEEGLGVVEIKDKSAAARSARAQIQLLTDKIIKLLEEIGDYYDRKNQ